MANLGWLMARGLGGPRDVTAARELYEAAITKGNAAAMNRLGLIYANGDGLAKDEARARELYQQAAAAGEAAGTRNLMRMDIGTATRERRHGEALDIQERLVQLVEAYDTSVAGAPGDDTATAFATLGWIALLAGKTDRALAAVERSLDLRRDRLATRLT